MNCPHCQRKSGKFGTTRDGQQRYRCKDCKKSFSEPKPLPGMATPIDRAVQVLKMLLEGVSIRATSRLTGVNKQTILRLVALAGKQCDDFLLHSVDHHPFTDVQIDEQWGFIFCKEKTKQLKGYGEETGDCYTFIAIDRDTKFVISFRNGKRSHDDTWYFAERLRPRVGGRPQITTDGWGPYRDAIRLTWREEVDFAQLVKEYGNPSKDDARKYSPGSIIGIKRKEVCGDPKQSRICTSHVERLNLSNRMQNRRMTRLTNGHSKKWENHEAMLALWFAYYNWCRPHMGFERKGQRVPPTTPAMAAGFTREPWTLEKLLTESARVSGSSVV